MLTAVITSSPKMFASPWSCSSLSARFVLVVVLSVASLLQVSINEGDGLLAKALLFLTLIKLVFMGSRNIAGRDDFLQSYFNNR